MKKYIIIASLTVGAIIVGCNRQQALTKILADPQMKGYIMTEMLKSEATRAQLADSIFADANQTNMYLDKLVADEYTRADLLNRMLKVDPTGQWIVGKLAQNPVVKAEMGNASK
jgi:hypothetical protein